MLNKLRNLFTGKTPEPQATMTDKLRDFFAGKKVVILGFGLEGQSAKRLLENLDCAQSVTVIEKYTHTEPLPPESECDIIMKSPGIPLFGKADPRITGQVDLFLRFCNNKVIGVTGTKGKSTTSSLIHHILQELGEESCLIGNIGVPPFDVVEELDQKPSMTVVAELSCHQLEYCQASPHIAVFLNLYEEHLDHYVDFEHYRAAKENIFKYQGKNDVLIRGEDVTLPDVADSSQFKLRGKHNLKNLAAAVKAVTLLNIDETEALEAAYTFAGLEHRLELFEHGGVKWVNDSISTIPAAAIAAVEAFPETDTLIIGGMDRGIDYSALIEFLQGRTDIAVIALPDSGYAVADELPHARRADNMADAVSQAKGLTVKCCVLSPAAASYGFYENFEERGRHFKELVRDD
jgi:UDP-N-acetylmuramoylalanine--D-glutamate ligase